MHRTLLLLFLLMCVSPAHVLGEEEIKPIQLEEVVVTATKTMEKVSEAPASVSVITSKDIETKNVQRADEALKNLPGVYMRGLGSHAPSNYANTVTLRGIPGYYRTLVLIDDQPLNDAFSGGVNWSSIPIEGIKRIEVVPGPFSSLYGGSAMGGVINILTKVPDKREFIFKSGYGSDDLKSIGLTYRDRLFDRLGLSINYGYKESNGYIGDYVVKSASSGVGTIPVTGWERAVDPFGNTVYLLGDRGDKPWWQHNAGLKLFYDATPSSKISLGISYHKYETDFDSFNTYLRNSSGSPVSSGNITFDDNGAKKIILREADFLFGPNGEEIKRYTASYETGIGADVKLKVDMGFMDNGYWYIGQFTSTTKDGGPGKFVDIPNRKLNGSTQISFPVLGSHLFVIGVSAMRDKLDKKEYDLANWKDADAKGAARYVADGKNMTYALFLQDEIFLRENLTFYLGGRYDYWETEGDVEQFTAPAFHHEYSARNKSVFSPKASVVYRSRENTTLRASVGKAFRAPTLSDMYSTWIDSSGKVYESNPDMKPEKTTSWEIGAEHHFPTGTTIRATYYENYLTDLIYSSDVSPTLNVKRNAGKAEIKGVELEVRQELLPGITAFTNFTYNDAKITENSAIPETEGKRITYTPQRMFNMGLEGGKGLWSGSIMGRYVGDVHTNDKNLDLVNDVYGSQDTYFVLDAKLSYRIKKWLSASLAVNNILDRDYYQSSKAPGRTFLGEVTVNF